MPQRLTVCDELENALHLAGPVALLAAALRNLSADLRWDRSHTARRDGTICYDGHVNALIAGPGGC
jgi:hypothetical protein